MRIRSICIFSTSRTPCIIFKNSRKCRHKDDVRLKRKFEYFVQNGAFGMSSIINPSRKFHFPSARDNRYHRTNWSTTSTQRVLVACTCFVVNETGTKTEGKKCSARFSRSVRTTATFERRVDVAFNKSDIAREGVETELLETRPPGWFLFKGAEVLSAFGRHGWIPAG